MNLLAVFILSIAAIGGAGLTVPSHAASPSTPDGLVPVPSRNFHEFYLRSNVDLAGYRRIMIDPVQVEFRRNWQTDMNYPRNVPRWIGEGEVRRISEETASSLESIVTEAFKARGYEIATAPEPGVLRLSLTVTDLYVYAPDAISTVRTTTFVRDAGGATLLLGASDAANGTILARGLARGTTPRIPPLTRANSVSNRFSFDSLFWRWATGSVDEMTTGAR